MSKRKSKKNKIDIINMACSDLRVYKDNSRPTVFKDKRRSKKTKQKEIKSLMEEI